MKRNFLNILCIATIVAIVGIVGLQRVQLQLSTGPFWDTYAFLANALYFAGKGIGYMELERPPMLSLLLSIIFMAGYVHESAIYYLDLLIHIAGVLGIFLLMRLRFNEYESLAGSITYGISPMVLKWVSVGYTDMAAISFSIWALYFTVLAVKKNGKYFYFAFPMAAVAFLTRFNIAFIVIPMTFMIIIHRSFLRNIKEILSGIFLGFLVLLPFLVLYYITYSDPFLPFTTTLGLTETLQSEKVQYIPDALYYIRNIPSMGFYLNRSGASGYIILLPLIGLVLYAFEIIRIRIRHEKIRKRVKNALGIFHPSLRVRYVIMLVLTISFFITFGRISYIISDLIMFTGIILFYMEFNDGKSLDIDLMILCWLLVFLNFHSNYTVKVDRYFLTLMPPLAYLFILGIRGLTARLENRYTQLVYPLIILFILSSSLSYLTHLSDDRDLADARNANRDVVMASSFFEHNLDCSDKRLVSDYWPAYSWYLRRNVNIMPTYNDTEYVVHELETKRYDYYFTFRSLDSAYYTTVFDSGSTRIYARNGTPPDRSRALYIGTGWHHYLEDVLDFKVKLDYDILGAGRLNAGRSLYIDSYSPRELKAYPRIFLFNFRWHDRNRAESILRDYVENGGTLIIDASGNLDGVLYNLDNTTFLNTTIQRSPAPIKFNVKYGNRTYTLSNFVSEDGGVWYGATYSAFGGEMNTVSESGGRTIIGIQRIGRGKIIWIGYNLVFHAFYYKNSDEKELIRDLLGLI